MERTNGFEGEENERCICAERRSLTMVIVPWSYVTTKMAAPFFFLIGKIVHVRNIKEITARRANKVTVDCLY